MMSRTRNSVLYGVLLAVETAAASFLFLIVFPLFSQMIAMLGQPQELAPIVGVEVILGALVLISAYFARYRWIEVRAPFQSAFVGHLVQFASRVSFIFGGALFSVLFFQHLPELDRLVALEQALPRGLVVLWVLFALFCYSLELDRLGRAIETGRARVA